MSVPVGNETVLDGVMKDVFGALSQSLNYDFILELQPDRRFGALQSDGSFSGIMGALQRKETDIGGPLIATEQRAVVADFTNCLGFSTLGIITGIETDNRNIFLYTKVFSLQVMLSLFFAIIGVSFTSSLIHEVSLGGWKTKPCNLVFGNIWLFCGYLVGKSTGNRAVTKIWYHTSFRILLAAWLLGPVINFLLTFQGSITSTFAVTKLKPVIADLEELMKKTKVNPVITRGSSAQICFKAAQEHAPLWMRMENNSIDLTPEYVVDTLRKIEKGTHILIIDYVYALVVASSWVKDTGRCKLQVQQISACQSFITIALRKGLPPSTMRKIDSRLTYIVQAKLTDRWLNRVFSNYTHCSKQPSNENKPLTMPDIQGVFFFWGVGILFSCLALINEIAKDKIKKKKPQQRIQGIPSVPSEAPFFDVASSQNSSNPMCNTDRIENY